MFDVVIPAFNESRTIARVVDAVLRSDCAESVLVVDDGSSDDTSEIAIGAGAGVLRHGQNLGKGKAMRSGVRATSAPYVVFLDADLLGFRAAHLDRMCELALAGRYDMVCGLRDYGLVRNIFQLTPIAETITGERACRREMLEQVPDEFWSGFRIEAAINHVCRVRGERVRRFVMQGVSIVDKTEKQGLVAGTMAHWKMFGEVGRAQNEIKKAVR